jgi:hypothetical protein
MNPTNPPKPTGGWGSSSKQPESQGSKPIRSAFEDRTSSLPIRKRRRLGDERKAKTTLEKKLGNPGGCSVCGGAHPTRMCDSGK